MRKGSVNTVLTLLAASFVLAAVIILVVYVTSSSYDMAADLEKNSLLQLAQSSSRTLTLYLHDAGEVAKALATQDAVIAGLVGNPDRARDRFRNYINSYKSYWAVFAFDAKGSIIAGFNAAGQDMTGGSRADRSYVKDILAGKDLVVTNKILHARSGDTLIFVVAAAVHGPDGKLLGGVAVCPKWSVFTKEFIDPLRIGQRGYGFMIDAAGTVIAHAMDKGMLLQSVADQAFIQRALAQKQGILSYDWKGETKYMAIASVASTGWLVCMSAYESEMTTMATGQRNILLVIGGLVLAAVVIGITVVNRRLVLRPLTAMGRFTEAITNGNFQAGLDGTFRFELGLLAENLRRMVAELKNKLGFAEGVLTGLTIPFVVSDSAGNILFTNAPMLRLLEIAGEPRDFIGTSASEFFYGAKGHPTLSERTLAERRPITNMQREITTRKGNTVFCHVDTAPIYDLDGNCTAAFALVVDLTEIRDQQHRIEEQNSLIAKAAEEARQVADRMTAGADALSAQIEEANNGAQEQNNRVQETVTSVEEMNATILEVARNAGETAQGAQKARDKAREGAELVIQVVAAVGTVREAAAKLKDNMRGLGEQAHGIGAVLGVISDIADQTNLLALNAAIEAARAGEAGRGFAVVADEVRKLAEKTMHATKEVGEAITGIQRGTTETEQMMEQAAEAVGQATSLAERSGTALTEIVSVVETAGDQIRTIATAAEQQSTTSEEINRSIEAISRIASENADTMAQSAQAVVEMAAQAQGLSTLVAEISATEDTPALPA